MNPVSAWETAYLNYQTDDQEIRKFIRRFAVIGVEKWDRELKIVEIFCGKGNALHAWDQLGFRNLSGLDLSEQLVSEYKGPHRTCAADAREMPFADASFDVVSVNSGLHHLATLSDLENTVAECHRILRPGGRLVVFEPWLTPLRRTAHFVSSIRFVRRVSRRLDSFAALNALEYPIYDDWLARPDEILAILLARFKPAHCSKRWGRLRFLGTRRN